MEKGTLTLVATPIGNLGDLSPRSVEALSAADVWLVEDSRISGKLAAHLGLKKSMKLLTDRTNPTQLDRLVEEIKQGRNAVVITDGGTPCVSDPGSQIVDRCRDLGIAIQAVPGPSAVNTALMLSGFFAQRYAFLGFLGRKPGDIKSELLPFKESPLTLVLFENILRLNTLLGAAFEALGDRRVALCRELTKSHEQVHRTVLGELPGEAEFHRKGELTVVIEGLRRTKKTAPPR